LEDRSDGRKAGYGLGENLPENGICVIHLSRTFKELLMKIVRISLTALTMAAAGAVFAQTPGPDQNTLKACDDVKYACEDRATVKVSDVLHRLSKRDYNREIFKVLSRPVAPTFIYIVKEESTKPVPQVTTGYYEVVPNPTGPDWAYVPK